MPDFSDFIPNWDTSKTYTPDEMAQLVAANVYDALNTGFAAILASHEQKLHELEQTRNGMDIAQVHIAMQVLDLEAKNQSYQCVIQSVLRDKANEILLEALGGRPTDEDGRDPVQDPKGTPTQEIRSAMEEAPGAPEQSSSTPSTDEVSLTGAGDFTGGSAKLNLP
jgi:hypothetical protein